MTDASSMREPTEPRRRHAAPASRADVLALVERAARVPDGLALLQGAPLECLAILLGVAPAAVERVRAALEDPALRDEATRHFTRTAALRRPVPPASARPAPPRDPDQLLAAAQARADGLTLLLDAAPEAAAIAFGVHPDLVHGARAAARRSGEVPDAG